MLVTPEIYLTSKQTLGMRITKFNMQIEGTSSGRNCSFKHIENFS